MTQDAINTKIDTFWEWFVEQEDIIKDFFLDESEVDKDRLIEEMNNMVLDFGRFSWEIGPERGDSYYLVISPNSNPELLALSKNIISAAPDLSDWTFYPAKPPKVWDWKLHLYDDFLVEREVDASRWQFVMVDHPGNQVEIIFEADNLGYFDAETQKMAGEKAVINLLGEERKIRYVRKVRVVKELGEGQRAEARSIQDMKEEWRKWVK